MINKSLAFAALALTTLVLTGCSHQPPKEEIAPEKPQEPVKEETAKEETAKEAEIAKEPKKEAVKLTFTEEEIKKIDIAESRYIWPKLGKIIPGANPEVIKKIGVALDFKAVTGMSQEEAIATFQESKTGITKTAYTVNYNKNGLLSLAITVDTITAYPSSYTKRYNFNTTNGEPVALEDLIYPAGEFTLGTFAALGDQKLQVNIQNKVKSLEGTDGAGILKEKTYKFTQANLADYTVKENGIALYYDFQLPHVIKAIEPNTEVFLTFAEINDYLPEGGPLAGEKR